MLAQKKCRHGSRATVQWWLPIDLKQHSDRQGFQVTSQQTQKLRLSLCTYCNTICNKFRVMMSLPGWTSRHCRDLSARDDSSQPAIPNELHTTFAWRRKSFPAERTYCRSSLPRRTSRLAATCVHVMMQASLLFRTNCTQGSPGGESPFRQKGPTVGPACRAGLRGLPRPVCT